MSARPLEKADPVDLAESFVKVKRSLLKKEEFVPPSSASPVVEEMFKEACNKYERRRKELEARLNNLRKQIRANKDALRILNNVRYWMRIAQKREEMVEDSLLADLWYAVIAASAAIGNNPDIDWDDCGLPDEELFKRGSEYFFSACLRKNICEMLDSLNVLICIAKFNARWWNMTARKKITKDDNARCAWMFFALKRRDAFLKKSDDKDAVATTRHFTRKILSGLRKRIRADKTLVDMVRAMRPYDRAYNNILRKTFLGALWRLVAGKADAKMVELYPEAGKIFIMEEAKNIFDRKKDEFFAACCENDFPSALARAAELLHIAVGEAVWEWDLPPLPPPPRA